VVEGKGGGAHHFESFKQNLHSYVFLAQQAYSVFVFCQRSYDLNSVNTECIPKKHGSHKIEKFIVVLRIHKCRKK
jgi:hypothetical protein